LRHCSIGNLIDPNLPTARAFGSIATLSSRFGVCHVQLEPAGTVTSEALVFAARLAKLDLSKEKRDQLMNGFVEMKAYPDVQPALQALSAAGIRLGFLSNLTEAMMEANIKSAGLEGRFEQLLSTDRVQAYKLDPRAYQMGIDAFRLPKQEILFAAFGGWDAAGAKGFGYETYWANRLNLPVEELGVEPDAIGGGAAELAKFAVRA